MHIFKQNEKKLPIKYHCTRIFLEIETVYKERDYIFNRKSLLKKTKTIKFKLFAQMKVYITYKAGQITMKMIVIQSLK